jgi:hypothetical protein
MPFPILLNSLDFLLNFSPFNSFLELQKLLMMGSPIEGKNILFYIISPFFFEDLVYY